MNLHREIKIAKIDIQRVVASLELCPGFDDDEQLKIDMLEGETGLFEIIAQLLNENEDDAGDIVKLDAQMTERAIRAERAKARIEARKVAIVRLMECAGETSLKLPEATLSVRLLKPRPKVTDLEALPSAFAFEETVRKPDREAIAAAIEGGATIPGVTMTNGGTSLTVRRK